MEKLANAKYNFGYWNLILSDAERNPIILINSKSRRGASWAKIVTSSAASHGIQVLRPKSASHFQAALAREIQSGRKEIWIGGGDGTVRQAAKQIVGKEIVLGILPLGTGNALGNELGIPANPTTVVDFLLTQAVKKPIDVGKFGNEVFVNVATQGLTAGIALNLCADQKRTFGRFVYFPAMFRAVKSLRPTRIKIESEDGNFNGKILQFVAASTKFHGGLFEVSPTSSINDGKLSVYVVGFSKKVDVFRYFWAIARGRHTELESVWTIDTAKLKVTLPRRRTFVLDGDFVRCRQATLEVVASGLTVLAAPGS